MKAIERMKFSEKFKIASVQFGTTYGNGIAAGVVAALYFVRFSGLWSPLFLILGYLLMFFNYFLVFQMCRKYKVDTFRGLYDIIYGKAGKVFGPISEIYLFVVLALVIGSVNAGFGSYMNQLLGWPIPLGIVIMALVNFVAGLGGQKALNQREGLLSLIMIIFMSVIFLVAIFGYGMGGLKNAYSTGWKPESLDLGTGIIWAFFLTATTFPHIGTSVFNAKKFTNTRDLIQTKVLGLGMNILGNLLPVIAVLCFVPGSIMESTPTLYIMTDIIGWPPLFIAFTVLMLASFVTTGIGCTVTMSANVVHHVFPKSGPITQKIWIPLAISLICIPLGWGGIVEHINTFAPINGIIGIIFFYVPMLIRAPYLLIKKSREEKAATKIMA